MATGEHTVRVGIELEPLAARVLALKLAAKSRGSAWTDEDTTTTAEAYLAFLTSASDTP